MKRCIRLLPALVLFAGCADIPQDVNADGNAPLIVDLDEAQPIVPGDENGATVRGPDKGNGERGGITGTFVGNGGPVCVVLDPESNFTGSNHLDDGDMDLEVGRAADYTGTPGVTMGDFSGEYVDPLGVSHTLDQNLCLQLDYWGLPGGHAGAGQPEYCTIETDPGVPYIVHGETFSAPPDDEMLTVAVLVLNGACPPGITESFLSGDSGVN